MKSGHPKLVSVKDVASAFSQTLRILRESRGLSQEAVALESGMHRTFVSQLERGIKTPSLFTIIKLAAALKIPASEFVGIVTQTLARDAKQGRSSSP